MCFSSVNFGEHIDTTTSLALIDVAAYSFEMQPIQQDAIGGSCSLHRHHRSALSDGIATHSRALITPCYPLACWLGRNIGSMVLFPVRHLFFPAMSHKTAERSAVYCWCASCQSTLARCRYAHRCSMWGPELHTVASSSREGSIRTVQQTACENDPQTLTSDGRRRSAPYATSTSSIGERKSVSH